VPHAALGRMLTDQPPLADPHLYYDDQERQLIASVGRSTAGRT
jgi:hypothetical protein